MRDHFLRASGVPSSGGSGSFERGFYGGTGTSLDRDSSGAAWTAGTWSSTTKNEANAWCLYSVSSQISWFTMYWNSQMVQGFITAKELTDAGVPSGAKFNKFSTYVWGKLSDSSSESDRVHLPLGIRWNMFHTTASSTTTNEPGYAVKSGESRTLLYQDSATTRFPPFNDAFDYMQDNQNGADTCIESMQLEGITRYGGTTSTSTGTGLLVEIDAGGGSDSSASPSSFFTWDGSSDVIVEISGTKANYTPQLRTNLYKNRNWKSDVAKYDDSRDDTHYGSTYWIGNGTLASPERPFSMNTTYMGGKNKMLHSSTSETNDWYDITNSDWSISTLVQSDADVINALKLDYTT